MDLMHAARRVARALFDLLPIGPGVAAGAADRQEERDRLFKVFTLGGIGGHGTTPPTGRPPENLRGGRPDQPED